MHAINARIVDVLAIVGTIFLFIYLAYQISPDLVGRIGCDLNINNYIDYAQCHIQNF